MKIEDEILIEENELKPNKYVANIVLFTLGAVIIVELLNETGVFHVNTVKMRLCCILVALCALIVQAVRFSRRAACSPKTKYFVLTLILIEVLTVNTFIPQWTELSIALPILIAMQYHSKSLTRYTILGAFVVCIISAPLSIVLGTPQLNFYEFLIRSIGYKIDAISPMQDYELGKYMLDVFKYISLPRCLLIGALWPVAAYITELVSFNIKYRADATYFSSVDIMTGLLNRFSFEAKMNEYRGSRPKSLICIYADADGLHSINNEKGHAAGDEFLKFCAECMADSFGELSYRIGGDEFLAFSETKSEAEIERDFEKIGERMAQRGWHMSLGQSSLSEGTTIDALIREAESGMYKAKHQYYISSGRDRRRSR